MPDITTFSIDAEHVGAVFVVDGITYTSVDFIANSNSLVKSVDNSEQWKYQPSANFELVNS
jgi:hypothetical protein